MTPKPSQTDLSIKSYDKNSARNGLPSAAAKLTPPLRIMREKTKYYFVVFSTEKCANFDYEKVFDHGEFNDNIYNLCTTTQGCYARPQRHQDRAPIGARSWCRRGRTWHPCVVVHKL